MPNVNMQDGRRLSTLKTEPLRNFKFHVSFTPVQRYSPNAGSDLWDESVMGGFTSVSGLSASTEPIAYREGGYNAQPLSAKVLTVNGFKAMSELEVGDRIVDPYGQDSKVTGIYPKGVRDIYNVTTIDGEVTTACYQHLWEIHFDETKSVMDTLQVKDRLARGLETRVPVLISDSEFISDTAKLLFKSILSVEYAGQEEVQCISVSAESHLYVTDNFIATHNTTIHQVPGMTTFSPISMQRGVMLGNAQALQSLGRVFSATSGRRASSVATDDNPNYRYDITIRVFKHPRDLGSDAVSESQQAMKFVVYNAWLSSVSYSDLNAGENGLLVEQIMWVHEGFEAGIVGAPTDFSETSV